MLQGKPTHWCPHTPQLALLVSNSTSQPSIAEIVVTVSKSERAARRLAGAVDERVLDAGVRCARPRIGAAEAADARRAADATAVAGTAEAARGCIRAEVDVAPTVGAGVNAAVAARACDAEYAEEKKQRPPH